MILSIIFIIAAIAVLTFGFVIAFGAPFLPTLKARTSEALDLLDLKPGQTLLELGSGDGRILHEAATRGIYAVGYELNPFLVLWSKVISYKYRKYITVHWGNYWSQPLPLTDGIYVFLLDRYMKKLDKKITHEIKKEVKVVSYAFDIPGREPDQELNGLKLYRYKPKNR